MGGVVAPLRMLAYVEKSVEEGEGVMG